MRNGRVAEKLCRAYGNDAREIDAAAGDILSDRHASGQTFARERTGVQIGGAAHNHAVDGNFFSGLNDDDGSDFDAFRIHALEFAVLFNVGVVGPDIHQFADVFAAFADSIGLKPFADLIKEHHRNGFGVVARIVVEGNCNGAERGNRHQEVFVENAAVANALCGLEENVIADQEIGNKKKRQPKKTGHRRQGDRNEKRRRQKDAHEHLFLLCCHKKNVPPEIGEISFGGLDN